MRFNFPFLNGKEIGQLSKEERKAYARAAFRYWRRTGFPYPRMEERDFVRAYVSLVQSTARMFVNRNEIQWSPVALGLANYFHPHIWSTKCERFRTPVEVFNNDEMLRHCIDRAMLLWKDRRPLSPNNMRRMLSTFTNTKRVSNFRPTVARSLYDRYSRDGDLIVDPAAGYGGRLLGCLPLKRIYIGIEPSTKSLEGMRSMVKTLRKLVPVNASVRLIKGCAEDVLPRLRTETAALVVCSPPYYARERYSSERNQSYLRYQSYSRWIAGFLEPLVREAWRILKPGGYFAINVANTESHPIADDGRRIARKYFQRHYVYRLRIGSIAYHRNGSRGGHRTEPLLIYRKGRSSCG